MDRHDTTPKARERRAHRRKPIEVAATVCRADQPDCNARSLDISLSGLGLIVPVNLPPGTACRVSLAVPAALEGQQEFEVQAVAVHTISNRGGGLRVGLRFVAVSAPAALGDSEMPVFADGRGAMLL